MSISLATEAAQAPKYPALRFNMRERKLLESVQAYVDAQVSTASGSHEVFAAGEFTTADSASQTIPVAGALSSDLALVTLKTAGATPRTILTAASAAGQIDVEMSDLAGTDHVLTYMLLRAS